MLQIIQTRGGLPETFHPVHAALYEADKLVYEIGSPIACYWRSGCKPFQLLNSLEHFPETALGWLREEDLALGSASHSGEPEHVSRVLRLLRHFKLKESQLRCGAHWPMNEAASRTLWGRRKKCNQLHSNCSGKHTFMLAASQFAGYSLEYLPVEHPLQQKNIACIAHYAGQAPQVAVDGCGVPTFNLPISAMARAFASIASAMQDTPHEKLGKIGWAMHRHPHLVSGTGRLDRAVVRGSKIPMTVKVGAEGLFSIAVPERRWGLVIKVATGSNDALAVAVKTVVEKVLPGVFEGPVFAPWLTVRNIAGREVGERLGVWDAA